MISRSASLAPVAASFYGNKDSAEEIKLKDLEMGRLSWITQHSSKYNYKYPYRGGRGRFEDRRGKGTVKMEERENSEDATLLP